VSALPEVNTHWRKETALARDGTLPNRTYLGPSPVNVQKEPLKKATQESTPRQPHSNCRLHILGVAGRNTLTV